MGYEVALPVCINNDPMLSYFWRRLHYYDQNVLLIVVGQTGSCKSGSGITIGNLMDRTKKGLPRFNIDHVVFKAEDFISLVSSNLPKGSVIIWDEIGVEHDARNYYSLKNKLVKYVMQTFRYKNFMLIMTVPDLNSIDIGTRRLLHCYLEMKGPLYDKQAALGKIKFVQVNPQTGKSYYKQPRFFYKCFKKLRNYYVPRPPKDLEDAYKAKKKAVTMAWYADFNRQLSFMQSVIGEKEDLQSSKGLNLNDLAADVVEAKDVCFDRAKQKFSNVLVQSFFESANRKVNPAFCKDVVKLLNTKLANGDIVI